MVRWKMRGKARFCFWIHEVWNRHTGRMDRQSSDLIHQKMKALFITHLKGVKQCLGYSRCWINICWLKEWMHDWISWRIWKAAVILRKQAPREPCKSWPDGHTVIYETKFWVILSKSYRLIKAWLTFSLHLRLKKTLFQK